MIHAYLLSWQEELCFETWQPWQDVSETSPFIYDPALLDSLSKRLDFLKFGAESEVPGIQGEKG